MTLAAMASATVKPTLRPPILETAIVDLLEGQYKNPVQVAGFNTAEGWSQDVSVDVAQEVRHRCDLQMRDVPQSLQGFVDHYEGRYRDVQLPLPCDWSEHRGPDFHWPCAPQVAPKQG
jgi:hypothetical protein